MTTRSTYTTEDADRWRLDALDRFGAPTILAWGSKEAQERLGISVGQWANNLRPFLLGYMEALRRTTTQDEQGEPEGLTLSADGNAADVVVRAAGIKPPTVDDIRDRFGLDADTWLMPSELDVRAWTTPMRIGDGPTQMINWYVRGKFVRSFAGVAPGLGDRPAIPRVQLTRPRDVVTVGTVPDIHFGHRWSPDFLYLEPLHDRLAVDAAWQFLERMQPSIIHLAGDNVDAAALGDFDTDPLLSQTLSFTLREYRWWAERLRTICPHARVIVTPGNHPARLKRQLMRHVPEFLSAVREPVRWLLYDADNVHGLRLENLDFEWAGEYPERWHSEDGVFQAQHGESTNAAKQSERTFARAVLYGHTHHVDVTHTKIDTRKGPRYTLRMSAGTLGRIDGTLPGSRHPDWQQGVGYGAWEPRNERLGGVVHIIDRGEIITMEGEPIVGRDRSEEISEACGVPQFVRRA